MQKRKLGVKLRQVDGCKIMDILWPVKNSQWAGVNMFSLSFKLLKVSKLHIDDKNNSLLHIAALSLIAE